MTVIHTALVCLRPDLFGEPFPLDHPWFYGGRSLYSTIRVHQVVSTDGGKNSSGVVACGRSIPSGKGLATPMRLSYTRPTCIKCINAGLPLTERGDQFTLSRAIAEWRCEGASIRRRVDRGLLVNLRWPLRDFFKVTAKVAA